MTCPSAPQLGMPAPNTAPVGVHIPRARAALEKPSIPVWIHIQLETRPRLGDPFCQANYSHLVTVPLISFPPCLTLPTSALKFILFDFRSFQRFIKVNFCSGPAC